MSSCKRSEGQKQGHSGGGLQSGCTFRHYVPPSVGASAEPRDQRRGDALGRVQVLRASSPRWVSGSDFRSSPLCCRHNVALRAIEQAFRDLTSSDGTCADHENARAFLAGSPGLLPVV